MHKLKKLDRINTLGIEDGEGSESPLSDVPSSAEKPSS